MLNPYPTFENPVPGVSDHLQFDPDRDSASPSPSESLNRSDDSHSGLCIDAWKKTVFITFSDNNRAIVSSRHVCMLTHFRLVLCLPPNLARSKTAHRVRSIMYLLLLFASLGTLYEPSSGTKVLTMAKRMIKASHEGRACIFFRTDFQQSLSRRSAKWWKCLSFGTFATLKINIVVSLLSSNPLRVIF